MLATPGTLPSARQDARWAYETKQDGQRVIAYLEGDGAIRLRARSGEEITAAYPELWPLGTALGATSAVLDGEVLALDEQGRADFQLLQSRMGLAHAPGRAARQAAQVHQCHHRALGRAELAVPVALTGDDEHGHPLHECMGQVVCGRMDDQRGPRVAWLRRQTSRSTARGPRSLRCVGRHLIGGQLEEVQ